MHVKFDVFTELSSNVVTKYNPYYWPWFRQANGDPKSKGLKVQVDPQPIFRDYVRSSMKIGAISLSGHQPRDTLKASSSLIYRVFTMQGKCLNNICNYSSTICRCKSEHYCDLTQIYSPKHALDRREPCPCDPTEHKPRD